MLLADYAAALLKGAVVALPIWLTCFLIDATYSAARRAAINLIGWPVWVGVLAWALVAAYLILIGRFLCGR